ncbi:uncharacterized protein BDZ83DRAFT_653097 [Colletotrichum acutatum]|uniref:Uncharacterized protein n=1 Tax=Glomerella acutata TaxID=27357 RepID=A0AAD8UN80_GLOAC|nr:uncharacterized protein BDZ83DRAFT_653097 [Colletotrichum acutatum]KAK1723445.1 hypothetical protein BDZ83DRAFT_653097 [Colletotrichum acutatum]
MVNMLTDHVAVCAMARSERFAAVAADARGYDAGGGGVGSPGSRGVVCKRLNVHQMLQLARPLGMEETGDPREKGSIRIRNQALNGEVAPHQRHTARCALALRQRNGGGYAVSSVSGGHLMGARSILPQTMASQIRQSIQLGNSADTEALPTKKSQLYQFIGGQSLV